MSLRTAALAVTFVLIAAACGDPRIEPAAEGPTPDQAAADTTVDGSETATSASATTVDDTTTSALAAPDDTVTAPTLAGPTITTPAADGLDWVFASDPFPPQADAAADPAIATEAIIWAYRHWILLDLDPEVRARILENGEANTVRIEETLQGVRGTIDGAGFDVDQVDLTGVDSALVRFRITWQGGPSPIFPEPMSGSAVFRDGSWRVGGRTLCLLAIGVGQACTSETRLAPLAYRVSGVPPDAQRGPVLDEQGRELAPVDPDMVLVPGSAMWWPENSMPYVGEDGPLLGIDTLWLPDAASLSDDDLAVLMRARWGNDGGSIVDIAGGRGRAEKVGGYARLLVVRDDDVIVNVTSSVLEIEELADVVLGLVPVDPAG